MPGHKDVIYSFGDIKGVANLLTHNRAYTFQSPPEFRIYILNSSHISQSVLSVNNKGTNSTFFIVNYICKVKRILHKNK